MEERGRLPRAARWGRKGRGREAAALPPVRERRGTLWLQVDLGARERRGRVREEMVRRWGLAKIANEAPRMASEIARIGK
jgi:hypothetical protein